MGLRKRFECFESFIKTMRGFEGVDKLLRDVPSEGKHRADYLLWDREIILEQKALVVDVADTPQKFVDRQMKEGRLIVYGRTSTRAIFDKLPDGRELERRMFLSMTKGVEGSVAASHMPTSRRGTPGRSSLSPTQSGL